MTDEKYFRSDLTLQILEWLADQKQPVRCGAVAVAFGIQPAAAIRHLKTLENREYARRVGDCWELGGKCAYLWAKYSARLTSERTRLAREAQKIAIDARIPAKQPDGDGDHHQS